MDCQHQITDRGAPASQRVARAAQDDRRDEALIQLVVNTALARCRA